jgi:hypothetical protein
MLTYFLLNHFFLHRSMWPMIYPCCVDMLLVTMSDYPSNIDVIMLVDVPDLITGYYHIPVQISLFPTNQLHLIRFHSHHSHFCFHLAKKCESGNERSVFLSDRSSLLSPLEDDIVGGAKWCPMFLFSARSWTYVTPDFKVKSNAHSMCVQEISLHTYHT